MDRDCGWVTLHSLDDDTEHGRGRLIVERAPAGTAPGDKERPAPLTGDRGQLDPGRGRWHGRINPLRVEPGAELRSGARYRMRFEDGGEVLTIWLGERQESEAGPQLVYVEAADDQLPAVLLEVGGA